MTKKNSGKKKLKSAISDTPQTAAANSQTIAKTKVADVPSTSETQPKMDVASPAVSPNPDYRFSEIQINFMKVSTQLLFVAFGLSLITLVMYFQLTDGKTAVPAIAGLKQGIADLVSARSVFFVDTLFSAAIFCGFALLAVSAQTRGNRPLVRMILGALLIGLIADFGENAFVFSGLIENSWMPYIESITAIKFGALILALILLSAIVPVVGASGEFVVVLMRYMFPVAFAASLLRFAEETTHIVGVIVTPLLIYLIAQYVLNLTRD